jgi:hypothetical protein
MGLCLARYLRERYGRSNTAQLPGVGCDGDAESGVVAIVCHSPLSVRELIKRFFVLPIFPLAIPFASPKLTFDIGFPAVDEGLPGKGFVAFVPERRICGSGESVNPVVDCV